MARHFMHQYRESFVVALARLALAFVFVPAAFADRLSYLDEPCDPYYAGRDFPKLTTPQWVGEAGVEAVVILSIDDMRDAAKYEDFLRPILDRLKQIDGRAPVSIFTNRIETDEPQLQAWLKEGLSLEVHTVDHPCPLLKDGDFAQSLSTYNRCVDMMAAIPNNQPVAFRMPCCDSLNTPSPRFYAEIFNRITTKGNYLAIDSSVFNVFTSEDEELPQSITTNEKGESRFKHYLPFPSFVNTIENYPYPYIIAGQCWEFPCVVPSDWEAQNVQRPNNPDTVRDLKMALDATAIKRGVMPIVFHPHGWIRNQQLVEFIDYAVSTYGPKVKFLTFREALQRIDANLLGGRSLRTGVGESDSGRISLADLNEDGFMDVVIPANPTHIRLWNPSSQAFDRITAPLAGMPKLLLRDGRTHVAAIDPGLGLACYQLSGAEWREVAVQFETSGLTEPWKRTIERAGQGGAHFWRDLDADGNSELILVRGNDTKLLGRTTSGYRELAFELPRQTRLATSAGEDAGFRFRDLNADGKDDIVFSNGKNFSVHLFKNKRDGWRTVRAGSSELADAIPAIVRTDGTNNGAWFHSDQLWFQNEYTNRLPDLVDRVAFKDLIGKPGTEGNSLGNARTLQESLESFTLLDGHRIEVVAAEPQIQDPVAFDWGQDGKLWVVEMRDYPNGVQWHGPGDVKGGAGGRVKVLEDQNNDGRYETATVFLDKLPFPTGIKVWRDGVLITAGSEVVYAEDTDGDNRADVSRALYKGLGEGNQQHRANGLRWGLDHWLHLANGDSGGDVVSFKTEARVNIRGRDLRIRPDDGSIELTSGQTQFGRSRDNDGNWFGGANSNPIWHYVLEDKYLRRNPHYAPPSPRHQIAEVPGAAPVFPTSTTLERFNDFDRADRFTSACSPEVFRAPSLIHPQDAGRNFFYVCEPVHNLVHRSVISSDGVTFTSRRGEGEQRREFLCSSDNWFRPVMCRTGPDSSLWIADMYRMVIEHPEWIPLDWQKRIDHLAGSDRGRIYRVVFPPSKSPLATAERGQLGLATPSENWQAIRVQSTQRLVDWLSSENGVFRDMVQQELYWRNDAAAVEPLRRLFQREDSPALVPAMYLLEHFDALDVELLARELRSPSEVRARHALRLAEPRLPDARQLRDQVIEFGRVVQTKPISPLKQQWAYTLGEVDGQDAATALANIGISDGHDRFMCAAVMSSVTSENVSRIVDTVMNAHMNPTSVDHTDAISTEFVEDLISSAVGYRNRFAVESIVSAIASESSGELWQLSFFAALLDAVETHEVELKSLINTASQQRLEKLSANARSMVRDSTMAEPKRLVAMRAFGLDPTAAQSEMETLLALIDPSSSHTLQRAAINVLGSNDDPNAIRGVLLNWQSLTPSLRASALDVVFSKRWRLPLLLDAIEEGLVLVVQVSTRRQQQLLGHADSAIRERASKLFTAPNTDRSAAVRQYADIAGMTGQAEQGRAVFQKQCSACHHLDGIGKPVGPDLTALSDKSLPAMLVAILDPNRAVEEKYLDYSLLTTSGKQVNGLLLEESATAVTLAAPNGQQHTVLRSQIDELIASRQSLMPEGLEKVLPPRDMANVIAFVQSVRLPRKRFSGNQPSLAPVRDDGSIRLFAMHAEIYGPSIVFEPKYRNLGFWSSDRDRAVWTIHPPKPGTYKVTLDYACPPQPQANRFRLYVNGQQLGAEVSPTASWDDYARRAIGRVELPDRPIQLTFQSDGRIEGFLLDLRTIILYPESGH